MRGASTFLASRSRSLTSACRPAASPPPVPAPTASSVPDACASCCARRPMQRAPCDCRLLRLCRAARCCRPRGLPDCCPCAASCRAPLPAASRRPSRRVLAASAGGMSRDSTIAGKTAPGAASRSSTIGSLFSRSRILT